MDTNIIDLMATVDVNRPQIIGSWLTEGSLCLFYGTRGCGKSTFAMGIGLAAANGCEFIRSDWKPSRQYKVLYMDSELGKEGMKRKFRQVDSASPVSINRNTPLSLMCPEHMGNRAWNLSEIQNQQAITKMMIEGNYDLLIIDNLLGFSGPAYRGDDEVTIWKRIEDWLLPLREIGKSIIIVHHSSKSGDQYGTIKKENPCDTVIKLVEMKDPWVNGLAINWHFTKGRWIYGEDQKALRINYVALPDGKQKWEWSTLEESNREQVLRHFKLGWKKADIGKVFGLLQSEVEIILKGGALSPARAVEVLQPQTDWQEWDV